MSSPFDAAPLIPPPIDQATNFSSKGDASPVSCPRGGFSLA
jgi:hypothetical protein